MSNGVEKHYGKKGRHKVNDTQEGVRHEQNDEDHVDQTEGKNPVAEALKCGLPVDKIYISDRRADKAIQEIITLARSSGIPFVLSDRKKLDDMSVTGHHQGVIARISPVRYSETDDIFAYAAEKKEEPFVFILDGIEDPHNFGAIIRTAHEAGAHGIIVSKRHSAGITPVVARAAAGACSHMLIARVSNIVQTLKKLKDKGMWFVCGDMDGDLMYDLDLTGSMGVVIGNEGEGVSSLVKKTCDMTASIPMCGKVGSLNASVAAAVLAYEVVRQRRFSGK